MPSSAFATLLTSDSYLPGALVTARSIKDSEGSSSLSFDLVCLVTLDSVSVQSIKALSQIYDLVISVEEIRSTHSQHELNLLGRQDLSSTITKIHIWRLTQYDKVIYLDSDTLLLRPISHLFDLDLPFSACPDIGWPDCFNSGLMVITPNSQTFENIFQHFLAHGSWDGGDQGILNDFFSPTQPSGKDDDSSKSKGWNRLSFIYNVTPSAYYTYAPAYKRYSDKISMVHFIGSEKPWHLINRRRYRNAYFPSQHSQSLNAIDYDSLVDSWLDVYEKVAGPVEPLEWGSPQPQFHVPKYLSQWDSSQPSVYNPPTLEDLKETFSRKKTQFGLYSLNQKPVGNQAGYISLPFLDLSSVAQQYFARKENKSHLHPDPAPEPKGLAQPQPPPVSNQSGPQHQSTSHSVWDAVRSPPPTEGYQMDQPFTHRYESAWDKPFDQQSHNLFQPPPMNYSIPPVTHQDYSQFSTAPQPQAIKAVFPWEGRARPQSGRIFPDSEVNQRNPSSSDSPSQQGHHHSQSASSAINQGSLRNIYRNAWDEDPMIERWAHARSFSTSGNRSSLGWGKLQEAQAGLARTPRLELKHFIGDQQETEGKKKAQGEVRNEDDVGRLHSSRSYQNPQLKRTTVTSPSYLSERDSEGSSQDADEEDVGEDEDQSSDNRNAMADETCSEGTIRTPTEVYKSMDFNNESEQTEKVSRASMNSIPRVPTTRSVIVGVPIKFSSSSNSTDSESGGHNGKNKHSVRTSAEPLS